MIERVKCLCEVLCWIFCWSMFHGHVDQLESIAIKLRPYSRPNQCYNMQERANILKISKSNGENHLHQLGYVNCFDVWVPHKLSDKNLN